ncbi:MAG: HEAT repeat domain-containing protein [candidate division WS1 bacterium]|jgi:HEAT repeat protein|nr:HEAT repeat domain-containing protein [candidate division WS1 bacterium]
MPRRRSAVSLLQGLLALLVVLAAGCAIDPMPRLNEAIEAEDVEVRRAAVLTLANLNDSRTLIALTEVFEDDDELRDMAATALVKKGREQVTDQKPDPIIDGIAALANNVHLSEIVRARAAWMLGEIGDREAIPALKTASAGKLSNGDNATLLREQATQALEKLGYQKDGRPFEIPICSIEDQTLTLLPIPEPIGEQAEQ